MKSKKFFNSNHLFKKQPFAFRKKKIETAKDSHTTEVFERCVLCGEVTDIPVSTPIDLREYYEVGCGQLCASCYNELRKLPQPSNALSQEKILIALENSKKERPS